MKNKNHSGFTLVELIIVIAVIGVLAAILIPVFSNVISKANEKSALSDAKNTLTSYLIEATDDRSLPDNEVLIFVHKAGRYYVYGYQSNTFMSSGNNDDRGFDMSFSDLQSNYNYDASRDDLNTALTQYNSGNTSVFGNKLFWMYPTNRSVPRGIRNIDLPGYNNLGSHIPDVSDNVDVYQGILLPGAEAVLNGGNSGSSETPITYTVTFNATGIEDSADLANVVYTYKGEAITGSSVEVAKDDPVGYLSATYNYNAATDSYRYRVTSMTPSSGLVTAPMTVTVNFEKINIRTLSFVMGSGETFVPANESVEATMHISAGDDITTAVRSSSATTTTPNRVFSHWEKQGDSSVQYFPGSESVTMPDSNLTLVPVFTKVNITLKYYTDGEHLTGDYYQETEPYNSTTYRLPYFTTAFAAKGWTLDTGYTFNGWYDGHNTYSENALYTTFEGDEMTFTAVIIPLSFTVRYGTGTGFTAPSGTTNCIVGVDTSFAISGVTVDSAYYLTGYAVSGFASAVEPLAANATALDLTAAQAGNEIVITPQVAAKTVNVTFVSDPTSVATLPANITGYEIKDGDITLTAPTGVAAHYSFTSYTASGTNITASITNGNTKLHLENPTANTSSVTVTAHFEADPTYTVTYDKNTTDTVSGMPANDTGVYAGSHTLSSATPTRTGYNFLGWGTTAGATSTVSSITVSGNTTVYAVWQIRNFTLTYNVNGGTGSVAAVTRPYNTVITLADGTGLSKDGCTFGGWAETSDGTTAITTWTLTADKTVYAIWTATSGGKVKYPSGISEADAAFIVKFVDVTGRVGVGSQSLLSASYEDGKFAVATFDSIQEFDSSELQPEQIKIKAANMSTYFDFCYWPTLSLTNDTEYGYVDPATGIIKTKGSYTINRDELNGGHTIYIPVGEVTPSGNIITHAVTEPAILPSGERYMDR